MVSSYILVFASLLLAGGRLADVWGRKRLFLIGLSIFTGGLAGRRVRRQRRRPGDQPSRAGPRRRPGHADHAGDHLGHLHRGPAAGGRGRDLERGRRARPRGRSAARRRCSASTSAGAGSSSSTCRSAWRHWRWPLSPFGSPARAPAPRRIDMPGVITSAGSAVRADLRADRGPRPGLDVAGDPGLLRRRRRPGRRLRAARAAVRRADGRRCRCSASGCSPAA